MTDATAPEQPAEPEAIAPAPAPVVEKPKAKPAAAAKPSKSPAKVVCAGCGKTVELDTETTVGDQAPIRHHSCAQMAKRLHDWWIALLTDPQAEKPEATK